MRLACSSDFSSDNNFMLWEQTVSSKNVPTLWLNFLRQGMVHRTYSACTCTYIHDMICNYKIRPYELNESHISHLFTDTSYKPQEISTDLHLGILPLSWYSCCSRIGCFGCFVWIRRSSSLLRRRLLRCGGFCRGRLLRCGSCCHCASRHFHCIDDGHLVMFSALWMGGLP